MGACEKLIHPSATRRLIFWQHIPPRHIIRSQNLREGRPDSGRNRLEAVKKFRRRAEGAERMGRPRNFFTASSRLQIDPSQGLHLFQGGAILSLETRRAKLIAEADAMNSHDQTHTA
jgi:hypothetical protein